MAAHTISTAEGKAPSLQDAAHTEEWAEAAPFLRLDGGGAVRVGGTRVCFERVIAAFNRGEAPEGIVSSFPTLTIEAVDAAISYYLSHREAVQAYLNRRDQEAAELRREMEARFPPDGIRERLLARRAAKSGP